MRTIIISLLTAALAVASPTKGLLQAIIVIEASHGGPGTNATNSTISVPVGPLYRNKTALAEVSTLYLVNDRRLSCIPYMADIATGPHGFPFAVGYPAVMSNDTVTVGCILCTYAG
ncbi:hypothetical protein E0Z10_g4963 [Xylaria hypoxylon]|uniref:Uncharacterized protein n=1 Tax=Xylaria hypoxylon TaxID=37992 RepID=A0A4Z0YX55_9PEZI|nr:hypothetical protein E0Z10_g4963 [Xylaria hypoxylon]